MSKRSRSNDDAFARALEARHEQILKGKIAANQDSPKLDNTGERIDSAVEILELLAEFDAARQQRGGIEETKTPAYLSTAGEGTMSVPESVFFEIESIGRFKILEPLGRGGFGVVFRAFDPELQRDVAIKISRWDLASSAETRQRFQREAIAAAGLNHPGIVRVYEVDSDRGLDYIVSELVDGESVAQVNGRLFPVREAAQIVRDVADALEHAHQRGVLHRDLKPANILLADQSNSPHLTPKISDFGLAAIQGQTSLTQTGAMVGTPEFMSPEQAAGDAGQIGPATDIYALGGILYCLLAGRSPFAGNSLLKTLAAIKKSDPPLPSRWNPDIPRDLESICLKCLEKQPAQRYSSARELQADLSRFLDGRPVTARRVTDLERCIRWCRRNPLTTALSATLLMGLVSGLITVGYLWRVSENNYRQAELNEQKYIHKSEQLTSAVDRLFVSLANHPEIRQASADGLRRTLLEEAHRFQQTFLLESPEDPQLQLEFARSMKRLADIYAHLGDYRASLDLLQNAFDIVQEQRPVLIMDRELMDWWTSRADVETHLGEFQRASQSFQRATEISETTEPEMLAGQHARIWQKAQIQIHQARSLLHQDKHRQAEAVAAEAQAALQVVEQAGYFVGHPPSEPFFWNRGVCRFILAQASRLKGRFNESVELYKDALADFDTVAESTLESDGLNYDRANCLLGLGLAWAEQNKPDHAVDDYRQSLAILTKLTDNHPQVEIFRHLRSSVEYSLAANRMVLDDFAEFRQLIDDNIERKQRLVDDFPDARAKYLAQLGDARNLKYFGLSREASVAGEELVEILREAKRAFEQSLELNPDWNRPKMAICRVISNLGIELAKMNEIEPAIQCLHEAIDRLRAVLQDQPNWAEAADQYYSSAVSLIFVLQQNHWHDEAIQVAESLIEDCPNHRRAFSIRLGKAKLLAEIGRHEEAYQLLETVCELHARSWQDYGRAADMAMKLSGPETADGPADPENYVALAVRILGTAMEAYPQSQDALLDWVQSQPRLADLAAQLD